MKIGWTVVKVELLKARPLQCFKCWEVGHLKSQCSSRIDRSGLCYRCGQACGLNLGFSRPNGKIQGLVDIAMRNSIGSCSHMHGGRRICTKRETDDQQKVRLE